MYFVHLKRKGKIISIDCSQLLIKICCDSFSEREKKKNVKRPLAYTRILVSRVFRWRDNKLQLKRRAERQKEVNKPLSVINHSKNQRAMAMDSKNENENNEKKLKEFTLILSKTHEMFHILNCITYFTIHVSFRPGPHFDFREFLSHRSHRIDLIKKIPLFARTRNF